MSAAQIDLLHQGGEVRWFSQRPKPYTNCMFAAVCVPLSLMGYDLPPNFVDRLREASGVPRKQATSTADTRRALNQLIPGCPIDYGGIDDDFMLKHLAAGDIAVRVMLDVGKLPQNSPTRRHFKPTFTGGHAVALDGATAVPGGFMVHWLDPMGRPANNYKGIDVPFADIEPALRRTPKGRIKATTGWRDAALEEKADEVDRGRMGIFAGNPALMPPVGPDPDPDSLVLTRGRQNEFATIPAGTPFLHPLTRAVVSHAVEKADFRLAGRSTDGKFAGVWVNTRRVKNARGATLLIVDRELIGVPFPS